MQKENLFSWNKSSILGCAIVGGKHQQWRKNGYVIEVESKWGEDGVFQHHPRDVPDIYSEDGLTATAPDRTQYQTRVYYRQLTKEEMNPKPNPNIVPNAKVELSPSTPALPYSNETIYLLNQR